MKYFEDIHFIRGEVMPACKAVMDASFPGTWSIEFLLSGRMAYGVGEESQIVLDKPVVFWHVPKRRYRYGAIDERGWHHHWIMMKGSRARRLVEDGFDTLSSCGYVAVQDIQAVTGIFRMAVKLLKEGSERNRGAITVLLERLLCLLEEEARSSRRLTRYARGLEGLAGRVRESPMRETDFHAEAEALGLSYSRFRYLFRRQFGLAPHEYLLGSRMRKAALALTDGEQTIKQAAHEAGYEDVAQFSKLFKKKIGLSPSLYRATNLMHERSWKPHPGYAWVAGDGTTGSAESGG